MMTDISMETTGLLTDQAPPEILMMSDDADRKAQVSNVVSNVAAPPAMTEGAGVLPNPPAAEQTMGSTSESAELVASGAGGGREAPGGEKMATDAELRVGVVPEGVYLTSGEQLVDPDMVRL